MRKKRLSSVQTKVDLEPSKYVIVYINGKAINCALDSGTQVFVCNSDIFPDNCNDEFRKITLRSAFRENVDAKLIKTSMALDNYSLNFPIDCLVEIADKLNAEALIHPSLYESLCLINDKTNKKENEIFAESADSFTPFSSDEDDAESGEYFMLDKILNEPVMQLVLPRFRIDKVMKLASESQFLEAIWELRKKRVDKIEFLLAANMSREIAEFVQTCKGCQLRKSEKI
ncbi:integrase catalytic domain-containing protein [Trichonephila clavata]|uniref:Integrase catalytic domain-containing protein n=1 Tax=Trichonephila clavata TaxID=2740835 RepID=A0A8X6M224_TRICU|nr:integrase catalytic domain-containing protein [Trichonephila clavata]